MPMPSPNQPDQSTAADTSAPAPAPAPAPDSAAAASPSPAPATDDAPKAGARATALLDSLMADPATPAPAATAADDSSDNSGGGDDDDDDGEQAADAAPPSPAPAPTTPAAQAPAPAPAPVDAEESALLEGVKSGRAQERIREVFRQRKQLEQDIDEVRSVVRSAGLDAQTFAQTLELARLSNSADEREARIALEMLDAQRAQIAKRLGVDVPGVDVLAEHADLAQAVQGMEMTRERAIELAKYRNAVNAQQQQVQQAQQAQQQTQQYQQQVQQAQTQIDAYFATRANEVDHAAKMKVIEDYFADQKNVEAFASTYEPAQWLATMRMMYDNVRVAGGASPQALRSQQPIRSKPSALGVASPASMAPIDRMSAHLDALGI